MNGKQAKKVRKVASEMANRRAASLAEVIAQQRVETAGREAARTWLTQHIRVRVLWWFRLYLRAQDLWQRLGGRPNLQRRERLRRRGMRQEVVSP